ncbi:MAG: rhomboid family intramembrane serine protease [Planctomycetes bacterium]|nr:rhomboid family intramembrane serine protease [Planctomycetota bacterium]
MAIYRFNPRAVREPATYVLIGLNTALALVDGFTNELISRLFWARGFDVYYGDYWRPLAAGFAHATPMHIMMNMYSLFVLGKLIEPLYGTKHFLLIYFTALLGGSALSLALSDPNTAMLGASGAIFGLFGALLGYLFSRTGSWQGVWSTPYGRQLIIVLALNVVISLMPGISLLGHLGGFVPGLFLGIFYERRMARRESGYDVATYWLVMLSIPLLTIYSCIPFNRASFKAVQALKAYERGDLERGDELREEAKNAKWASQEGTQNLLDHLKRWREDWSSSKEPVALKMLRLPLTHIDGVPMVTDDRRFTLPYTFLESTESRAESHP